MKKIFYLPLTLLFIGLAGLTFAQDAASKKVQAGMTFNAGANFLSPGTTRITSEGAGSLLSIGVVIHSSFTSSENLGLATGLEFDFGKNIYVPNSINPDTYVDYADGQILTQQESLDYDSDTTMSYSTMQLDKRTLSTTKLTIPVMLLFRTNFIGDFRYFGKFGLRNTFQLVHKFTDEGNNLLTGSTAPNELISSPGEFFVYNGSVGLSAGAEWNFVGSTSLVLEAGYYYGITPFFIDRKEKNQTMYTIDDILIFPPSKTYYSASARQNQLIFKLTILF